MRRLRPTIETGIVVMFGAAWCLILLYLCIWCPLNFEGKADTLDSIQKWGKIWMGMSGFALFYFLFVSRHAPRAVLLQGGRVRIGDIRDVLKGRRALFQGLMGGLLCSLPALAITLAGLVVAVPHPESWSNEGKVESVSGDFSRIWPAARRSRAFLVGIDLSRSAIEDSKDPRLSGICAAINALLLREQNGAFSEAIKTQDHPLFFVFAGNLQALYPREDILVRSSNAMIAERVCRDLKRLADGLKGEADSIARGRTDIVGFLEDMVGKMGAQADFEEVTLVVFSDFHQDDSPQSSRDRQDRLAAVMKSVADMGSHVVGVSLPLRSTSGEQPGTDIRKTLRYYGVSEFGRRKIWREISLEGAILPDEEALRTEFIRKLFREETGRLELVLKYHILSGWSGVPSTLELPDMPEYERVLLELRSDEQDDDSLSKVSVSFGDPSGNALRLKMGEAAEHEPKDQKLIATLSNPLDISRTLEFDLMIVVPDRSAAHKVRVAVIPSVGHGLPLDLLRWALGLGAVTFIFLFFGASGLDLLVRQWAFKVGRWIFGSRQKVRTQQPASGAPE